MSGSTVAEVDRTLLLAVGLRMAGIVLVALLVQFGLSRLLALLPGPVAPALVGVVRSLVESTGLAIAVVYGVLATR